MSSLRLHRSGRVHRVLRHRGPLSRKNSRERRPVSSGMFDHGSQRASPMLPVAHCTTGRSTLVASDLHGASPCVRSIGWMSPRSGPSASSWATHSGRASRGSRAASRPCSAPERPSTLEFGNDEPNHVLVGARRVCRRDNETVTRIGGEPLLHLVGNLATGTDEAWTLQQCGAMTRQVGQRHVSPPMWVRRFCTSPRMPETDPMSSSVIGASRRRCEKS